MNKISIDVYNEDALKTPIICLHGFLESKEMWSQLHLFFLDHPIYCLDLPGHGDSLLEEKVSPTMETLAQMIVEVLDRLRLEEFHIIGHSMGGYVGLSLLELLTKRVKSLVLLNSNYLADSDLKKAERVRSLRVMYSRPDYYFKQAFQSLYVQPERFAADIELLSKRASSFEHFGIILAMECITNRKEQSDLVNTHKKKIFYIQGEKDGMFIEPDFSVLDQIHWCSVPNSKHMSLFENRDFVISYIQLIYSSIVCDENNCEK